MERIETLFVVVCGFFSGCMLLIASALVPYWSTLNALDYRVAFQALGPSLGRVMVPLMFLSIGLAAASCFARRARPWRWTALVLLLTLIPLYALVHAPVNALLLGDGALTEEQILGLRSSWVFWHWARTLLGAAAFYCGITVLRRP